MIKEQRCIQREDVIITLSHCLLPLNVDAHQGRSINPVQSNPGGGVATACMSEDVLPWSSVRPALYTA